MLTNAGVLASIGMGAAMPIFAYALSSIIAVFFPAPGEPLSVVETRAKKWVWVFVGVSIGIFFLGLVQQSSFVIMGQQLARRVRVMMFKALLRQVWHVMRAVPVQGVIEVFVRVCVVPGSMAITALQGCETVSLTMYLAVYHAVIHCGACHPHPRLWQCA